MPARSPPSRGRRAPTRAAARSFSSSTRRTRAWPRPRWSGSPPSCSERHSLIAVAIHHRVGVVGIGETSVVIAVSSAHRARCARRLRRGDRHAQGHGAAVEEGDLRRRRGMDRAGLVSSEFPDAPAAEQPRPPRRGWARLLAPLLFAGAVLLKVAGSLKFLGIFVAVGGYALIWGWRFGVGFVLLILVHELGHYVEARRQGLNPQLPVFIPFLGAYVALAQPAVRPVAERARLGRRAGRGRGRRRSPASSTASAVGSGPAAGARVLRLLPQPLQPDPDRVSRRRPHPPRLARPARRRRRGEPRRGAPARRRRRGLLASRSPRPSRSAWSPRTSRRTGCDERPARPQAAAPPRRRDRDRRRVHRRRVPRRLPEGGRDRQGGRLDLRLGARGRGVGALPPRARDGGALREGGVRGRHRRRARA